MTLTPDHRQMLESIAYSDDAQVSPRDRLDAIKTLAEHPSAGEAVGLALHFLALSDEALAAEVEGFFGPAGGDEEPLAART